ncbi:replication initiation protein (plasmid) [Clostridium estertheticum]|uniref:replication initiation protein n=1 Tax=Clostridium estertheticum TaxID=238834 RepID=UPI001C7CAB7D|nr:replication initiation protein [Clostridium estertheticum]MBX4262531.1 replication initiation protein [Clostridium estertheticum]WLC73349.1 replication initiation protein [Clostridium estertheticum]
MDKNYLVTKSNYFIMNSSYDLSLEEQKIILTLASMVQPTDEEFKPYNFKISEFMELVGVEDKSKYTEIPKITKELMKKVFEIQEGNTIIQTAWLSGVRYEKGSGMVTLKFNPDLKPYMIKLNTVFTQYKLTNILSMRSKYSIRMYEILKANEFKKQNNIEIDIYELRKLLKADKVYPLYNDFKRFVIQRTQKELKKLSDINFDFEEIKTGRKVTSLEFYIHGNKSNNKAKDEACTTIEGKCTIKEEKRSTELISVVKSIFEEDITGLQAKSILDTAKGDINIIKEKYKLAENASEIGSVVGWMLKAIKEDYQSPGKMKKSEFNNFEQRPFDPCLEAKLLGWDKSEDDEVGEEYNQGIINV